MRPRRPRPPWRRPAPVPGMSWHDRTRLSVGAPWPRSWQRLPCRGRRRASRSVCRSTSSQAAR
eukprot:10415694-Lingulodinium_polyedra.AAC.1